MIRILALETTGKYGSAAVITECGRVYCASSETEMNHLKDIITISDEALMKAGISKNELTHVAASAGPGSFTGIRIGVTTARTLGQMLKIPRIKVSSLEGMALRVLDEALSAGAAYIVPCINARRHQTYSGAWKTVSGSGSDKKQIVPGEKQYMIEELLGLITEKAADGGTVMFTGDGIDAYEDIIKEAFAVAGMEDRLILAGQELRYQDAGSVAEIALASAAEGKILSFDELLPEYMRLSEAEQRLREGTLSDKIRKAVKL